MAIVICFSTLNVHFKVKRIEGEWGDRIVNELIKGELETEKRADQFVVDSWTVYKVPNQRFQEIYHQNLKKTAHFMWNLGFFTILQLKHKRTGRTG